MELKIGICDDEPEFRQLLAEQITAYLTAHNITAELLSVSSGDERPDELQSCDVLFLDVELQDEHSGMELARKIRRQNRMVPIVFVSAFIQYTTQGYEVSAARYLIKGEPDFTEKLHESLHTVLQQLGFADGKTVFPFREKTVSLFENQIAYIESCGHDLQFHLCGADMVYTMRRTLDAVQQTLSPAHFIRAHKSFLINRRYVAGLENRKLLLLDGKEISIPRSRYQSVARALDAYTGGIYF